MQSIVCFPTSDAVLANLGLSKPQPAPKMKPILMDGCVSLSLGDCHSKSEQPPLNAERIQQHGDCLRMILGLFCDGADRLKMLRITQLPVLHVLCSKVARKIKAYIFTNSPTRYPWMEHNIPACVCIYKFTPPNFRLLAFWRISSTLLVFAVISCK